MLISQFVRGLTLFDKNPENVSAEDLKNFLSEQRPEGPTLDYKEKFSNDDKIAKAVSAMANTHGGWILVGVDEVGQDASGRGISQTVSVSLLNECSSIV